MEKNQMEAQVPHQPPANRFVLSVDYDEYNIDSYRGIRVWGHDAEGAEVKESFATIDGVVDFLTGRNAQVMFSSSFDNFKADGGELPRSA